MIKDSTPTIVAIWIKRAHHGPMDPVDAATLVAGQGIESSADFGQHRHVTLIEEEVWGDVCAELDADVPPTARRANVMVRGISLSESLGQTIRLGDCRVLIKGQTRPCERMDEAHEGLRAELSTPWRAGAWGQILDSGTIATGDTVAWVEETA